MTAPPPPQEGQSPPARGGRWGRLAARLTALFVLAGTGALQGLALLLAVRKLLAEAGVPEDVALFVSRYAGTTLPRRQSPFPPGPAAKLMAVDVPYYRAWYIVNAVRRLMRSTADGPERTKAEGKEGRYFAWHGYAVRNRLATADLIDEAAKTEARPARSGRLLLGWEAMMDDRTTAECRAANGKNFYADRQPLIGWPGMVHPHCRCRAVAPYPGARIIPSR